MALELEKKANALQMVYYMNVVDRHECYINVGCMHISHKSVKYPNEI